MCRGWDVTPFFRHHWMERKLSYGRGIPPKPSAGQDWDALAVDGNGQTLGTRLTNGLFHTFPGVWFDQEDHTAASARSADLARQRAIATGVVDDPVDGLRRDRGQVSLAEGPLFAHQAAGFGPVGFFES